MDYLQMYQFSLRQYIWISQVFYRFLYLGITVLGQRYTLWVLPYKPHGQRRCIYKGQMWYFYHITSLYFCCTNSFICIVFPQYIYFLFVPIGIMGPIRLCLMLCTFQSYKHLVGYYLIFSIQLVAAWILASTCSLGASCRPFFVSITSSQLIYTVYHFFFSIFHCISFSYMLFVLAFVFRVQQAYAY